MRIALHKPLSVIAALFLAGFLAKPVMAADLLPLVTEGNAFKTQLSGIVLTRDNLCAQMISADRTAKSYINNITVISNALAAPLHLDANLLGSLDQLGYLNVDITAQLARLSRDLGVLSVTAPMCNISDGLTGMLQLSDDIGSMADRILEMADKILAMADNIGVMADRIIVTQQLQNQNIALTQASILTTQKNMLSLVNVTDTATYNVNLQTLVNDGNALAVRLAAVVLNPLNVRTEMQRAATDVAAYAARVQLFNSTINTGSAGSTFYISQDSLLALGNMSVTLNSIGTAVRAYSVAINGIASLTSKTNLRDATRSMLSLSADIGTMSNRILEMSDLILAMADNIGLQADQILVTQQLQNTNIAATQASILSAQTVAIGLFATFHL